MNSIVSMNNRSMPALRYNGLPINQRKYQSQISLSLHLQCSPFLAIATQFCFLALDIHSTSQIEGIHANSSMPVLPLQVINLAEL